MIRRCLPLLLSSLAVVMFFAPPAVAQSAGDAPGLFKDAAEGPSALNRVGQQRMNTLEQDSTTRSIRLVRLVDDLSQQRAMTMHVDQGTRVLAPSVNPTFQRNSENEGSSGRMVELSIQRDGINAISEGTYAWTGTVRAGPGKRTVVGDVTLVHGADGNITGTIRVESEYYLVRPLDGGLHALVEEAESMYSIGSASPRNYGGSSSKSLQSASNAESTVRSPESPENSAEKNCHASTGPLFPEGTRSQKSGTGVSGTAPCSQIATDVLVVYTDPAADGRNIDGIINTAIQEANDTYENSNAYNTDVTLAHSQQVSINGIGSGGIDDDLGDLQSSGTVQSFRDQHDADVVVLLTADIYGSTKGKVDEIRAEEEDAFAIVAAPTATGGQFVFPHEVGHLQGAQHRPVNACTPGTACDEEGELFPDAFANQFEGDDSPWCLWLCGGTDYGTITALPGGYTRVKHLSNPNVSHDGGQTGTGSRNNANAVQATANTVEDFRISDDLRASMTVSGTPGDSERTLTADVCGGTGSYNYEWRISYNGPGDYGPPGELTGKLHQHVSRGDPLREANGLFGLAVGHSHPEYLGKRRLLQSTLSHSRFDLGFSNRQNSDNRPDDSEAEACGVARCSPQSLPVVYTDHVRPAGADRRDAYSLRSDGSEGGNVGHWCTKRGDAPGASGRYRAAERPVRGAVAGRDNAENAAHYDGEVGNFFLTAPILPMHRHVLHSVLLTALASTLLFGSCGFVGGDDSKVNDTYFRATVNGGKMWAGDEMRATFSKGNKSNRWLTVIADTVHKQHYPYTERLVFVAIFEGVGTYPLTEREHEWDETGSAYYENDGDVLIASYHPTEDASANRLTITSYDSTTGVLEGTFRTTVVVDSAERVSEPGEPPRRRPDTLRFTDGEFRVKVRDLRDE